MNHATIVVVDDEALHRALLTDLLRAEAYTVIAVESAQTALEAVAATPPDLFLVDVVMPEMDGFELCRRLKAQEGTRLVPVVLVTGLNAPEDRVRGIEAGADDFLSKPVHVAELLARVRSLVRLKRYMDQLDHAEAVLFSLGRSVEARDAGLEGHCERLAHYAVAMGEALGLDAEELEALRRGAVLHDIGKIGIPDALLFKPGPLTAEEWRVMREHPVIGERICQPLKSMRAVLPIIRHHHERWNGSGYPDGLAGPAIPLTARVLQVADVFDALTTVRPYRKPLPPGEALSLLHREVAQGLWDPAVVELFGRLLEGGARFGDGGMTPHATSRMDAAQRPRVGPPPAVATPQGSR
jgi:putative two-component system response regulator